MLPVFMQRGRGAVRLARRTRVDCLELMPVLPQVLQRVPLVELERVVRLRANVHADNLEAGTVVAHRRTAGPAEQIKQSGLVAHSCFSLTAAGTWTDWISGSILIFRCNFILDRAFTPPQEPFALLVALAPGVDGFPVALVPRLLAMPPVKGLVGPSRSTIGKVIHGRDFPLISS